MYNLTNKRFGKLVAIEPIKKNKRIYWKCQCDCGNLVEIRTDRLINGRTKSCGCYKKQLFIENNKKRQSVDLTGKKIGKLTPIEPTDRRSSDGRIVWKCQCDCGNICYVNSHDLTQKRKISCGCLKSYGELVIKKILKENNISFKEQYRIKECIFPDTGYQAVFDFYVNNSYIVEYDGEQHFYYKDSSNTWNTKENFLKTQKRDNFKNQWCKEHNIPIIRIPYFKLDEITIKDLILEESEYIVFNEV